MEKPSLEAPRASGLPLAAALLAGSQLLSRVLGYAREALLADRIGANANSDAYYAAFQLPDILNYLLAGGALSIAFLPFYTRLRARGEEGEAERLLHTVLGTLGVAAALATVGLWVFAEPLVALQFGGPQGFDPETKALTTRLTRIVLPAQVCFVLGGIVQATLFARGRFGAAAAAPLLYNGGIIAGGLLLSPRLGVEGFSWGALAGAVLGPLLAPVLDARGRVRLGARVAPLDPDFRRYLLVAAPLMFGQTLLTVDEWFDRWFGSRVGEGVVAALSFARRLMQVPVAVVGQALGAAAFPTLARLWAEGRRAELDRVVETTLNTGLSIAVLAGAAALVFAGPLVGFVYHHGAFTNEAAQQVTVLLAIFAFAVPAWVGQQIAVRAFYARGDTWRPMLLGTAVAILAIPLYLSLGSRFGAQGLAAAGAIGMSANALATLLLARRLHGAPALGALTPSLLRAVVISVAAGGAAALVVQDRPGTLGAIVDLVSGGVAFGAVAALGIAPHGDAGLRNAFPRQLARLRRRASHR